MIDIDVTIWPPAGAVPVAVVNTGSKHAPFGVVRLLGDRSATIQFPVDVAPSEQAKYLRALAEVATAVANELDPAGRVETGCPESPDGYDGCQVYDNETPRPRPADPWKGGPT